MITLQNVPLETFKKFITETVALIEKQGYTANEAKTGIINGLIDVYKKNPDDIPAEWHELFAAYIKQQEEPAVKTTTRKAKNLSLETTNVGKKLRDKNALEIFYGEDGGKVHTGNKRNKKNPQEVTAIVSLDFEEVREWTIHMPQLRKIRPFDIEILTHAITLREAGNSFVSTDMLFRQMNGGKDKEITPAMREEIYDSFSRLGQTWITIDASEEYAAGYNIKAQFRGALLPCSMVIGDVILQGKKSHDCIKIYDTSPLYEYAKAKGQISAVPVAMLDIPSVNRTEENIMLIGYLTRAYADMRNDKNNIRNVIRYETLYEYIGVEGSNAQVIRNKKTKIRATVRAILDAWIDRGFIKGYQELTEDNKPVKARIPSAKIRLDFYTVKELKESAIEEKITPST